MPAASPGKISPPEDQAPSQRKLRKRELDRNAQRNARERTKNRIAQLERLVEDLRHTNAGEQVARLVEQLSEVTHERDELSKALRTIENVLKTTKGAENVVGAVPRVAVDRELSGNSGEPLPTAGPSNFSAEVSTVGPGVAPGEPPKEDFSGDVIIPHKPACDCSADKAIDYPPQALNRWRFANETLSCRPRLPKGILRLEDATAEDTPVRAMIEGWDAVEASGRLPPLWQNLRRIDQVLFSDCPKVVRLAILRLMHLLYRYHAGPTRDRKSDLPSWYLSRPSQESIAHSYAINFFVWPGLRERFIFSQHRYCSNAFWRIFADNIVVVWPYEFRDCYTYNTETGQYAMSAAFDNNIRDINCWTMRPGMYEPWPEMRSDIPAFFDNEIPTSLPDPVIPQDPNTVQTQVCRRKPNCNAWREQPSMVPWPVDMSLGTLPVDSSFNSINLTTMPADFVFAAFTQQQDSTGING